MICLCWPLAQNLEGVVSAEDLLVRMLNWRPHRRRTRRAGFLIGKAEPLIGGDCEEYRLQWSPAQHTFICGRTGSGKSTFLRRVIQEHMRTDVPFLAIDFHGQEVDQILAMAAGSPVATKLVLLEPWGDPVVGWNPLELAGDSPFNVVQELIAIFRHRLWPDSWGPRLEETLRNLLIPIAHTRLTLAEAPLFLTVAEFRRAVLREVPLPDVREFWTMRFERLAPSQRTLVTETILNKLSLFRQPPFRYLVGQEPATLDFDRALKSSGTVIANFSTSHLRGSNFLLGSLLIAKLKAAICRRPADSKSYSLFLDEFQELSSLRDVDDFLRSARKFGVSVFLATQHLELPREIKAAVFGNCSRFVCFATSASDAAVLGREFGGREGNLSAQHLPELGIGEAMLKVRGEPARLLRVVEPTQNCLPEAAESVRQGCARHGRTKKEIEKEIGERVAQFLGRRTLLSEAAAQKTSRHTGPQPDDKLSEGYQGY